MRRKLNGLTARQFYALIWKDFVVHKRHYIWTVLEITIPVLVCAMAILSNSHQGKPKLENERTFEPDDYERIYGELNPARHRLLVAPNSSFTRALVDQIDDGAVQIELCNSEIELEQQIKKEIPVSLDQVKRLLPDDSANVTIGGVVIQSDYDLLLSSDHQRQKATGNRTRAQSRLLNLNNDHYYEVSSKLDGKPMKIPLNLDLIIRAKDFRLGSEPFPKKYSLGPYLHSDHYSSTYFIASQIMLSRAYISLLNNYLIDTSDTANGTASFKVPSNDDIIGQRMPYPKYVAHKRLKETTLGTFVAGSQKQKPFVLTMDYCITVGFLVTAIFLAKRIVDEKKSKVRDMLRLVGISDWTYYGSHMTNTMLIMSIQCFMITMLFTGHQDAPAQNIDSFLLFSILFLYCVSAIMFVLLLSTLFNSSTKAIIFTSLLWLGLPEVLDRIFKMDSGVIESNGFMAVNENVHLMFCLIPNFALRLMNRLLTECDIYGEFFDKKQLYGEYRAIWPNVLNVLPLYKSITLAYIMLAMLLSVPLYISLIYLMNSMASSASSGGLMNLSSEGSPTKSKLKLYSLIKWLITFVISLIIGPFKLIYYLFFQSKGTTTTTAAASPTDRHHHRSNLSQASVVFIGPQDEKKKLNGQQGAYFNQAYTQTGQSLGELNQGADQKSVQLKQLNCNNLQQDDQSNCFVPENQSSYFERAPKMLNVGVSIRNLCKTYITSSSKLPRIEAVKSVSLDMYYSQILVLLGHNGAGKTTLIDIISGHNQKTSGSILINGHNIDTNPSEARQQVGFCPQFDVLFERLTVEEHLFFYGIVKGARRELKEEIEQLLVQSGLDVHRKKLSKTLSGGYKRKLSLAIAMIAKSKVLILDEPTSGMDPESRRKVWDFLQLIRHDRLILMTTHHMEEADALGDRIAVMSGGQVKCCGSALFLKKVFDAGYHLRISKSAQSWNQIAFEEMISSKYNLQDKLENLTPHELMYKFDASETQTILPKLFDDLEKTKDLIGIFGFGITVSTMDDVFMKIGVHFKDVEAQEMQSKFELANGIGLAKRQENGKNQKQLANNKMLQQADNGSSDRDSRIMLANCKKSRLVGDQLTRQHFRALLAKRYNHARKNWFQLLWILGISLACVASIVILIDFVIFKEELTPEWTRDMSLKGAGYGAETIGVYQFASEEPNEDLSKLRDLAFLGADGATSTAPTTTVTAGSATLSTPAPTTTSTSTIAGRPTSGDATASRRRRRTRQATYSDRSTSGRNESSAFLEEYWLKEAKLSGLKSLLTYTDINTQMIDLLTRQFADFREHYIIGGEKVVKHNKYIAWYNGEATHSFPISMNVMLNSILKQSINDLISGGQRRQQPTVNNRSSEFQLSQASRELLLNRSPRISLKHRAMSQINTLIAFLPHLGRLINLVFLPFSLAFITSYFVIFPTHERVTKSKHLQLMTGVPAKIFWLSHFLFDLILYSAYTLLVLAIYFVWDRVINDRRIYFANFEHSVALIALVTLFIFGALPLAYIFSFLAKKPTSAFSSFCVLTILTGTATLTLVSLYELKYEHSASATFKLVFTIFLWSARLIPSVSLLVGLQKLFALNTTRSICINVSPEVLELLCRYINSPLVDDELRVLRPERCCRQVCQDECYDQWPFFWSGWFGINIELTMLVFDALLFWFILVLIESKSVRAKVSDFIGALLTPVNGLCNFGQLTTSVIQKNFKRSWQVPQFMSSAGKNQQDPNKCKELLNEEKKIEQILSTNGIARGDANNYSMIVNKLTKVYSSNQQKAVDELSFLVDKSEFFGLLGVNGAGKSTTFKMLTGELQPTSGNSFINSYDLYNQRKLYLKQIGYCPQQDALIDNLTGYEMLQLFARLRGIPECYIDDVVEDTLDKLGLTKISTNDCQNYSGGNKRRLSVGMALIGSPEVIFLDEPTSGVDPRSRRRLWSTLIEFQKLTKSSIVMTSHSMNECECLCDRVAIMVGGKFKVLGSVQFLRTKLSQGFSLLLKLKPENLLNSYDLKQKSDLCNLYMEKLFSQLSSKIKLKDLHQTIIQYHIEPSKELTWSKMLTSLERAKDELKLEDYQITSDASLESIFLSLAKKEEL